MTLHGVAMYSVSNLLLNIIEQRFFSTVQYSVFSAFFLRGLQDAAVFFVQKMDNIPTNIQWNAMLAGGVICAPEHLETGRGPLQTLHGAMSSKRILWMTDGFIQQWPVVARSTIHRRRVEIFSNN